MRMLGKWNRPLDMDEAKSLLGQGAVMVDVRSAPEFAKNTVHGAVNLPLEELEQHVDKIKDTPCLLFCNSGARSHIAMLKLQESGLDDVYNVGAFGRAETLGQSHFGA